MTRALIVVDVQNDFISGTLAVPGGQEVAEKIARHIEANAGGYDHVVTTQDWHIDPGTHFEKWPRHCEANTWGAELHPLLKDISFDFQVLKGHHSAGYSGFEGFGTNREGGTSAIRCRPFMELVTYLRKHDVTEVDIVGLALDHCVKATALDAVKEGFATAVLLDYTAPVTPEGGEQAREELIAAGVRVVQALPL